MDRPTAKPENQRLKPRKQGDLGEVSAMEWLASTGAKLFIPLFHSPDVDLVADLGGHLHRIEVKTCTHMRGDREVLRSRASETAADGSSLPPPLDCKSGLTLGGPKYSQFEIDRGRPLKEPVALESCAPGEYRSGQPGGAVNAVAQSFAGSNPASPIPPPSSGPGNVRPLQPSNRERRLGRNGQAVINQKRRVTIPQRAFFGAGFQPGDRLRARSDGPGRVILEQMELPGWARENGDASEKSDAAQD